MGRRQKKREEVHESAQPMCDSSELSIKSFPLCCSTRMTLSLVLCLGFVIFYSQRVNLSVGMVCMVNHTAVGDLSLSGNRSVADSSEAPVGGQKESCGQAVGNVTSDVVDGPMVWSKKLQGIALSAFFWGYIVTQVPGGWLAARYGAKSILLLSLGLGSVLTLLMPIFARIHFALFVTTRVLLGVLHGMVFPAAHVLWANWAPPVEKSRLVGFSYAGSQIGNVIAMPLSGLLCAHGIDGGWPSVFYMFGAAGLVWSLLWLIAAASTPKDHRFISKRERDYIEIALDGHVSEKLPPTPWLEFLKSKPVWAITIANLTSDFGIYVFLTNLPTYLKENLGFDAEMGGVVSALPYIGFWAVMNITAFISDKLIESRICTMTVARKIFNSIGLFVPALALVILTFLKCDSTLVAVALLTIGVASCGSSYGAGFLVNHPEIAPQFAGILMGISNMTGTFSGMIGPVIIGMMTQHQTAQEWRHVFYMTAGIMTFGAIFYCIFGSGERQKWAMDKQEQPLELMDDDDMTEKV